MRGHLAAGRTEGLSFKLAWERGLRQIHYTHDASGRRQWKAALEWARPEFEAAFKGEPTKAEASMAPLRASTPEPDADPHRQLTGTIAA